MASYNGTAVAPPTLASGSRRNRSWMGTPPPPPAALTYYYRTANGSTRGSTTSLAAVPAGSVIERIAR